MMLDRTTKGREGGKEGGMDVQKREDGLVEFPSYNSWQVESKPYARVGREEGREGGRDVPIRKDGLVELPVIHVLTGGEQALRPEPGLVDVTHRVEALNAGPA
jgi:hypothetical protein